MSWKSWTARIVGYGLAPFTGGASIPIGEGIAQGIGSNKAIDEANAAQQAGTDRAVAEQQRASGIASDVYNQQRNDLAPWTQQGGQAANTLGGLLGFTPTAPSAGMASTPSRASTATATPSLMVAASPGRQPTANATMTGTYAGPRTLAEMGQPSQDAVASRQQTTQSSYGAPAGTVPMRNRRDGQVYFVPQQQVQAAQADGGEVVQ